MISFKTCIINFYLRESCEEKLRELYNGTVSFTGYLREEKITNFITHALVSILCFRNYHDTMLAVVIVNVVYNIGHNVSLCI